MVEPEFDHKFADPEEHTSLHRITYVLRVETLVLHYPCPSVLLSGLLPQLSVFSSFILF